MHLKVLTYDLQALVYGFVGSTLIRWFRLQLMHLLALVYAFWTLFTNTQGIYGVIIAANGQKHMNEFYSCDIMEVEP